MFEAFRGYRCAMRTIKASILVTVLALTSAADLTTSPALATGPATLVDSTGKRIGLFDWSGLVPLSSIPTGTGNMPSVLLKINGTWLAVNADYNGFGNHGGYLFYTTTDCSGTAYNASFVGRPVVGATFVAAGILHYIDFNIAQQVSFLSYGTIDAGTGMLAGCAGISTGGLASPDQTFDLSRLGFVPPFRLSVPVR
jgi:hypothetical protein